MKDFALLMSYTDYVVQFSLGYKFNCKDVAASLYFFQTNSWQMELFTITPLSSFDSESGRCSLVLSDRSFFEELVLKHGDESVIYKWKRTGYYGTRVKIVISGLQGDPGAFVYKMQSSYEVSDLGDSMTLQISPKAF